jgi:hypothetical protein
LAGATPMHDRAPNARAATSQGATSQGTTSQREWRTLLYLAAAGVLLRLAFLWLADEPEFQSDEANYVYLGLVWNYLGIYEDSHRFLWPPGYPFLVAQCMRLFGTSGLFVLKVLQVVLSASVGLTTMLFARRLFGHRAAWIAGLMWCLYLPLVGYTHLLWPETLFLACFLPSLYLLLVVMEEEREEQARNVRLLVAAGLFAAALYLKEVALYLLPFLALLLCWADPGRRRFHAALRPAAFVPGFQRASLFVLAVAVLVLPWTLRNYEVYGRLAWLGVSLGENAYHGLNEHYTNFDLKILGRQADAQTPPEQLVRPWFVRAEPGSGWERADEILNTIDRVRENARRGFDYAAAHPGWLLRSRLEKLADLLTPLSFFLRHLSLEHYEGGLQSVALRRPLVVWSLACPLAVMLLAAVGACYRLKADPASVVLVVVIGYFLSTSLVVSMSRFRVPFVPLLIVLAAGLLSSGLPRPSSWRRHACAAGAVVLLLGAWWTTLPEVRAVVGLAWP